MLLFHNLLIITAVCNSCYLALPQNKTKEIDWSINPPCLRWNIYCGFGLYLELLIVFYDDRRCILQLYHYETKATAEAKKPHSIKTKR